MAVFIPNFAPKINRNDCLRLLSVKSAMVGEFLIRKSSNGGLALSVKVAGGKVRHCKIEQSADGTEFWLVPDKRFRTIDALLQMGYVSGLVLDEGTSLETRIPLLQPLAGNPKMKIECPKCRKILSGRLVQIANHMSTCNSRGSQSPTPSVGSVESLLSVSSMKNDAAPQLVFPSIQHHQSTSSIGKGSRIAGQGTQYTPSLPRCLRCRKNFADIQEFAMHTALCDIEVDKNLPTSTWACNNCSSINGPFSKTCKACGTGFCREWQSWMCRRCMCANSTCDDVCKVCNFGKGDTLRIQGSSGATRQIVEGLLPSNAREVSEREQESLKLARQQLRHIQTCFSLDEPFVSSELPPTPSSLYVNGDRPQSGPEIAHHWRRFQDIVTDSQEPWSIANQPKSTDIIQGALGNCWFVSALSVVAERPAILNKVLVTKDLSSKGIYQVMLFTAGAWEPVLVDDTFPCTAEGRLAYTSGKRNQLWAPLIEKAAATLYGSYEALQSGSISEALRMLTGSPCETVYLDTTSTEAKVAEQSLSVIQTAYSYLTIGNSTAMDSLWVKISEGFQRKFLLGASTKPDCPLSTGLEPAHAYSVVRFWSMGQRLVCLRNPNGGDSCWTGPWGNNTPEWQTQTGQSIASQWPKGEDGVFWIAFADFVVHFLTIDMCKFLPHWDSIRLEGRFPQSPEDVGTCFQVRVPPDGSEAQLNVTLTQDSDLRGKTFVDNSEVLDLGILILHIKKGDHVKNCSLVGMAPRRIHPSRTCESYLKDREGSYVVIPISFNRYLQPNNSGRATCDFHSSNNLMIEAVTCPPDLLSRALILQTIEFGECIRPFPKKDDMSIYELDSQFVVENKNTKKSMLAKLRVNPDTTYSSSRKMLDSDDVVPPKHRQLICALTPSRKEESCSVQYQMDFEIVSGKGQHPSNPEISMYDIHAPHVIVDLKSSRTSVGLTPSKITESIHRDTSRISSSGRSAPVEELDPYADWTGGGFGGSNGAFGGRQTHTTQSIDAMLQDFLSFKSN